MCVCVGRFDMCGGVIREGSPNVCVFPPCLSYAFISQQRSPPPPAPHQPFNATTTTTRMALCVYVPLPGPPFSQGGLKARGCVYLRTIIDDLFDAALVGDDVVADLPLPVIQSRHRVPSGRRGRRRTTVG